MIYIIALLLSGCVTVYGPTKTGNQSAGSSTDAGVVDGNAAKSQNAMLIGNRRPDELLAKTLELLVEKGIKPTVNDATVGLMGAVGKDPELASLFLDCDAQQTPSNLTEEYRIVVQIYSAGEGANVMVQVNGVAGLVTADGNDKVKPMECKSSGILEKDILEALRK